MTPTPEKDENDQKRLSEGVRAGPRSEHQHRGSNGFGGIVVPNIFILWLGFSAERYEGVYVDQRWCSNILIATK